MFRNYSDPRNSTPIEPAAFDQKLSLEPAETVEKANGQKPKVTSFKASPQASLVYQPSLMEWQAFVQTCRKYRWEEINVYWPPKGIFGCCLGNVTLVPRFFSGHALSAGSSLLKEPALLPIWTMGNLQASIDTAFEPFVYFNKLEKFGFPTERITKGIFGSPLGTGTPPQVVQVVGDHFIPIHWLEYSHSDQTCEPAKIQGKNGRLLRFSVQAKTDQAYPQEPCDASCFLSDDPFGDKVSRWESGQKGKLNKEILPPEFGDETNKESVTPSNLPSPVGCNEALKIDLTHVTPLPMVWPLCRIFKGGVYEPRHLHSSAEYVATKTVPGEGQRYMVARGEISEKKVAICVFAPPCAEIQTVAEIANSDLALEVTGGITAGNGGRPFPSIPWRSPKRGRSPLPVPVSVGIITIWMLILILCQSLVKLFWKLPQKL